jgi:hypothetical protein
MDRIDAFAVVRGWSVNRLLMTSSYGALNTPGLLSGIAAAKN